MSDAARSLLNHFLRHLRCPTHLLPDPLLPEEAPESESISASVQLKPEGEAQTTRSPAGASDVFYDDYIQRGNASLRVRGARHVC